MGLDSVTYKKGIRRKMVQEPKMRGQISYLRSFGRKQAKKIRANQSL